ncbi:hypothetical protein V490_00110 [Pseudogymnoascus sp. VKM F-3557]|nr:hypothetical protein V490_00110 [Pseudogymnoascus sp. VKM F-3557]
MDAIQIYAIAAGGTLCIFAFVNLLPLLVPLVTHVSNFVSKHFRYPYILHRHRILGPWTRAGVVIQLAYLAINLFCVFVILSWDGLKAANFSDAGRRAGTLAEVNMIPLLAGPHFAFLADLIGLSLKTIRGVHRSAGWMTAALVFLHAMAAASDGPFPIDVSQNLFAVVGASLLCLILVLLLPLFRKLSYELFLRSHQALALAFIYAVWRHVPSDKSFPRAYIYYDRTKPSPGAPSMPCGDTFLPTSLPRAPISISLWGYSQQHTSCKLAPSSSETGSFATNYHAPLSRTMQYINLWIPSVSFWSFLQTHPFTVISWDAKDQVKLDLLIEPRRGLTRELLYHAKKGYTINPLVMFSGPHGANLSMGEYESVLMVASGFGIAAFVPHLKKLIYGYNTRAVRTRRIHLVWQIKSEADGLAVQEVLNSALKEDKLDDGCILSISVYVESKSSPKTPFGERASMYPGPAPLPEIFLAELSGNNIKVHAAEVGAEGQKVLESTLQGDVESGSRWTVAGDGRMLVAASREDPPRRILPGARTSKEYAPGSSLLRGQCSSETLSPKRTPLGELDSSSSTLPAIDHSRPFNVSTMTFDNPELTPLEMLPTEILQAVIGHLVPWNIKRLSCTSKRLRQASLSILFRHVKFEFSLAGMKGLKELLKSNVCGHISSFTYIITELLKTEILDFDLFKSDIVTPDMYMEYAQDMYDEGYEPDEFQSYMAIYKTVHDICSEQRSIIDEGADLILSSIFCALPLLREVRLSFREVLEVDDWPASDMIIKEELYRHHLQVVSSAIQSARSVGVAIHTVSLSNFNLPYHHRWEQPNLDPLSESLRQLLGDIKVLRVCGVDDSVLELLSHCVPDLQQLDMCQVYAPEKVIKEFFETNKTSIRSIGFHEINIPGLSYLDSFTPLSASMLCRCAAQQRGYNGCATTASAIAQRLSQPMWGKAVPGLPHVFCRASRADPTVLAHMHIRVNPRRVPDMVNDTAYATKAWTSCSQVVLANPDTSTDSSLQYFEVPWTVTVRLHIKRQPPRPLNKASIIRL